MSTPAINTNVRLFDLVRYMRQELHAADLITDDEYSWLCIEADMAHDPKGGSPSPRRLEDYDAIRAENAALRKTGNALREYLVSKDGPIEDIPDEIFQPFIDALEVKP